MCYYNNNNYKMVVLSAYSTYLYHSGGSKTSAPFIMGLYREGEGHLGHINNLDLGKQGTFDGVNVKLVGILTPMQ